MENDVVEIMLFFFKVLEMYFEKLVVVVMFMNIGLYIVLKRF